MNYPKLKLCCKQKEILVDWIKSKSRTLDEAIAIVNSLNYCPYCGEARFPKKKEK